MRGFMEHEGCFAKFESSIPNCVPKFLSLHLRRIYFEEFNGEQDELELVSYFLTAAEVLRETDDEDFQRYIHNVAELVAACCNVALLYLSMPSIATMMEWGPSFFECDERQSVTVHKGDTQAWGKRRNSRGTKGRILARNALLLLTLEILAKVFMAVVYSSTTFSPEIFYDSVLFNKIHC
ncbi:hypothetical protein RHSIM_Rhsim06G0214900 [Rhododendron simsii]|uniref:FBD domain-containing protein n=1 Tax=Rhododendron simsii TaxID=118357 RepID=A0A834GVC2_RHOSS|nr:hypothetical protein RHSIM_Rhsim06G0214900 [Rhododendron simsii]